LCLRRKLKTNWPAESHWFCPKRRDDDFVNYDNAEDADAEAEEEDLTSADKARLIREWERRQEIAYQLCIVYGLSAEEGSDWQDFHHKRLTELLSTCDRCVRNYHMGRKGFLKDVSECVANSQL
jgi:senataxin